jgi:hypothetical protein
MLAFSQTQWNSYQRFGKECQFKLDDIISVWYKEVT